MNKIISIDPSATGTTGICLVGSETNVAGDQITFDKCEKDDWKEHFSWIKDSVVENSISQVVYEVNNSISASNRTKHISRLFKLFGAIDVLVYFLPIKVNSVPAKQTKELRAKLLKKQVGIAGLEFKQGLGWFYQGNNISVHELDAFLVYWIWKGNNND